MPRAKPTWFWLAPILVAIGHWERTFYCKEWSHSRYAHTEYRYIYDSVTPYYWATTALAAIVLLIFGLRAEAIPAWLLSIALFFLGWWLIVPVFLT